MVLDRHSGEHDKSTKHLYRAKSAALQVIRRPDHRPSTFLGLLAPAMPNTFMVLGPHQTYGNATRSIEHAVEVIAELLQYCKDNDYTYVEPTTKAAEEWTEHVVACSRGALMNEVDSWM